MTTYLHPDLDILRTKLAEEGFAEVTPKGFSFVAVYSRGHQEILIDLSTEAFYEGIEVHFQFWPSSDLLERLGFPL